MSKKVVLGLSNQRGRATVRAVISSIALIAAAIMASEFWEDMATTKKNMMPVSWWAKPFLFAALCVLIGLEGTKVREDFKDMLGGPKGTEGIDA